MQNTSASHFCSQLLLTCLAHSCYSNDQTKKMPATCVCLVGAGCAHNPTGVDPTREQWEKIADLVIEKNHLPFFDVVRTLYTLIHHPIALFSKDAFICRFAHHPRHPIVSGSLSTLCRGFARALSRAVACSFVETGFPYLMGCLVSMQCL